MNFSLLKSILVLILLALATSASAAPRKAADDPATLERLEKQQASEAIERNYKATLKSTDQSAKPERIDPWQNMRGAGDSKAKR